MDLGKTPNLREVRFYVPCPDNFDQQHGGTDMVTGPARLLGTTPSDHRLEMIFLHFDCRNLDFRDEIQAHDIESHLRGTNWAALDSVVMQITRSIKHDLKLSICLDYVVNWRSPSQRTKDEDCLKDWGQKYLPQASGLLNLILDVATSYNEFVDC